MSINRRILGGGPVDHRDREDPLLLRFSDRWRELVAGGQALVSVSGGADSCALLDLCCCAGLPVVAWHLDHGLREDSGQDTEFVVERVADYRARGHHLDLITERASIPEDSMRRRGIEDAARRERYRRLRAVAYNLGFSHVVTAHHRQDQAETVLLNILRGADIVGRAGMPEERLLAPGVHLVRPLLDIHPRELRAWLTRRKLGWREDPSNTDVHFTRNYVRHRVLPQLEAGVPGVSMELVAVARTARAEVKRLDQQLDAWWPDEVQLAADKALELDPFMQADEALRYHAWRRVLQYVQAPMTRAVIHHIDRLAMGPVGKAFAVGSWLFERSSHALRWQPAAGRAPVDVVAISCPGLTDLPQWTVEVVLSDQSRLPLRNQDEALIDAGSVVGPLVWRGAEAGQRWQALGAPGHKSVLSWLGEHGVPSRQREHHPVICDDQGVVWIPGHTIADRVRVHTESTSVWHISALPKPDSSAELSRITFSL